MTNIFRANTKGGQDISVVLHGPVRPETVSSIASIRNLLPDAELIFSTWKGESINNLDCDYIITSDEPPAFIQHKNSGTKNNLNRLIRSGAIGVLKARRKYILKMRSDLILDSTAFLDTFNLYPKCTSKTCLQHKVLIPLLFSRTSYRRHATPFHLSDWAAFGLREDIQSIFSYIQEVKEPEFTEWFSRRRVRSPYGTTMFRMAPEQYIYYSFYRRYFDDVTMNDCTDNDAKICQKADEFVVSNFIVASYEKTGFNLPKYLASKDEKKIGIEYLNLWTQFKYEVAYKRYCDSYFIINESDDSKLYSNRENIEIQLRLEKHWNVFKKTKKLTKKIEEAAVILVVVIQLFFIKISKRVKEEIIKL